MSGIESIDSSLQKLFEEEKRKLSKERKKFILALFVSNLTISLLTYSLTSSPNLENQQALKLDVRQEHMLIELAGKLLTPMPKEGEEIEVTLSINCTTPLPIKAYLRGDKIEQEESRYDENGKKYLLEVPTAIHGQLDKMSQGTICIYPYEKVGQQLRSTKRGDDYEITI